MSKTAEIILLGHRVIERRTGCPYKPCGVTPFNVFHPTLSRKPKGESCLNWNGSLIGTLYLLEIYEPLTESKE